jgi:hypothetical protein
MNLRSLYYSDGKPELSHPVAGKHRLEQETDVCKLPSSTDVTVHCNVAGLLEHDAIPFFVKGSSSNRQLVDTFSGLFSAVRACFPGS